MTPQWLERNPLPLPYFTLCLNREAFYSELESLGIDRNRMPAPLHGEHADATCHRLASTNGDRCCVVFLRALSTTTPLEIAGLLVHEAVHIWQEYAEAYKINDANELEANVIQAISQRLMAEYVRQVHGIEV